MYEVGQVINIGYYGGFHCKEKLKREAKVIAVDGRWVDIRISLTSGGYRHMFGYDTDLMELENNYKTWR